jgi:hypothetical protein
MDYSGSKPLITKRTSLTQFYTVKEVDLDSKSELLTYISMLFFTGSNPVSANNNQ